MTFPSVKSAASIQKPKKLYDLNELLEIIPMSKAGLYLACAQGKIPTVKISRRIFVPAWWVEEILKKPEV